MRVRTSHGLALGIALCLMLPANGLLAQEHPKEHPKGAEHSKGGPAGITKEDLGSAIEAYIKGEMAKGGGAWEIEDRDGKATLHLTLDKVHKDKLAMTGKDTYFACADFKNSDGHMYDLDVLMKGPDKDHLVVSEVSVHKQDGKERYTWQQEGGVWTKVAVEKKKE